MVLSRRKKHLLEASKKAAEALAAKKIDENSSNLPKVDPSSFNPIAVSVVLPIVDEKSVTKRPLVDTDYKGVPLQQKIGLLTYKSNYMRRGLIKAQRQRVMKENVDSWINKRNLNQTDEQYNEKDDDSLPQTYPNDLNTPSTPTALKISKHMSIESTVKEIYGNEYRITKSPKKKCLNVEKSMELRSFINCTDAQYEKFHMVTKSVVSLSTLKRHEKKAFQESYNMLGDKLEDFATLVVRAVERSSTKFPATIKVTIGGDKGGTDTKISFYLNDELNPLSPSNLNLICTYKGDETVDRLQPIMANIDEGIEKLERGIQTKKGYKSFVFVMTGDQKFNCCVLGLQGGSAKQPCIWCQTPWNLWNKGDLELRSITSIDASAAEVAINSNSNIAKQKNGSVKYPPLLRRIPVSNYVPGPVHTCIAVVNTVIKLADKHEGPRLREYIKAMQISIHYPAQEYEGNQCRYIIKHFESSSCSYDGMFFPVMLAAGKVQHFAVARYLNDSEIEAFDEAITGLFQMLDQYPETLRKTKLHALKFHVISFVKEFKSWGLFSEQSIESLHHVKNRLDLRFHGSSNSTDIKRNRFFLKRQAIANRFANRIVSSYRQRSMKKLG